MFPYLPITNLNSSDTFILLSASSFKLLIGKGLMHVDNYGAINFVKHQVELSFDMQKMLPITRKGNLWELLDKMIKLGTNQAQVDKLDNSKVTVKLGRIIT